MKTFKSYKYRLVIIITTLFISSCAGIGIRNSSDPYKKLDYSYEAKYQGRHIPANRLILEAIEIFDKRNDKKGLAEAYLTYGNYHKYEFKVKPLTKHPDMNEAVKYFDKALSLFTELDNANGIARSHMGLGSSLYETDKASACEHYSLAITSYDDKGEKFPINKNYKDFPSMVKAFKDEYC